MTILHTVSIRAMYFLTVISVTHINCTPMRFAWVAELVDARDLKSLGP